MAVSSIAYANHVKKDGLPVLEEAIPKYEMLLAHGYAQGEIMATKKSLENLLSVWQKFTDEVLMYENYLSNRSKLDAMGGARTPVPCPEHGGVVGSLRGRHSVHDLRAVRSPPGNSG